MKKSLKCLILPLFTFLLFMTENYSGKWQKQHAGGHAGGRQQTHEVLSDQGEKSHGG